MVPAGTAETYNCELHHCKTDPHDSGMSGYDPLGHSTDSYYTSGVETIGGVPVTEETIQALADEAERGYDVGALRKGGRKPKGDGPARVVPVRLDDSLLEALDAHAEREHTSRSDVIRTAIRAYVA